MSKSSTGAGDAIVAGVHDSLCRRIRITDERIRLARQLEIFAKSRVDVLAVLPKGLEDLLSYRKLAEAGLAHATIRTAQGSVVVLAAVTCIWRRPDLKRRMIAIKRDARRIGRRVVLVTRKGLLRSTGLNVGPQKHPGVASTRSSSSTLQRDLVPARVCRRRSSDATGEP
ncbi:hypothetical protein [Methylobacterium radiotolerans]|uniref:hypothetical protein n=1 Tax=Methylobacterium radiotolerans TaxID=31998 RepID=UPI0038D114C7